MKSARNGIKWLRVAIWLLAILGAAWFVWQSRTRTSYSAVCSRCLQRVHGLEVKCGGVTISNEQKLVKFRPAPSGGGFILGSMPAVDPKIYADITDHACVHSFKRTGFCRYTDHGVACGKFSEGKAFRPRLEALDAVLRTFNRIPNRDLGKVSLDVLDRIFPPDATVHEANKLSYDFDKTVKSLTTMTLLLSIVETPEEWRTALDHFESGFQGEAPFVSDAAFIESRARSSDPLVRRGCAAAASWKQGFPSPAHFAAMLTDADEALSEHAGDKVFEEHQFALFGKLFRRRPPDSNRIEAMSKFSDADFAKLFEQDDPVVDDVCFQAIAAGHRLTLLDQVVERLNHRDSHAGREAVTRLIKGPALGFADNAFRDPWESFHALDGPLEKAIERVKKGYSPSSDLESLLDSMKALAATHQPSHWLLVKRAYEQAADQGVDGFYIAIMAKAMMEIDPTRTENYLIEELRSNECRRSMAALSGMGYLALPKFTAAITEFIANPANAPAVNRYPFGNYYKEGKPQEVMDYALHRCRGVQNWKLVRDSGGRYSIMKE